MITQTPIYNAFFFYILMILLIIFTKPSFMFDYQENKYKSFGVEHNQTLFTFTTVVLGGGIIIYLVFLGLWILNLKYETISQYSHST